MLRKLWNAVVTPSLTRRLVFAQLGLLLVVWAAMVFLIIRDIAFTDDWYEPRLMNNRATMILDSTPRAVNDLQSELRVLLAKANAAGRA